MTIISLKNNILDSNKIVDSLTPILNSHVPTSIKAQAIYLLSV